MRQSILAIRLLSASFVLILFAHPPSGSSSLGRFATLGPDFVCAQDPPPAERRYAAGPLTAADFKQAPPDALPTVSGGGKMHATTYTEMKFNYRYRFEVVGNRTLVRASEVDCYTVLVGDRSWNAAPKEAALLAHEQGHFDITEIHSRRTRQVIGKRVSEGAYTGSGANEAEARDKMLESLNKDFNTHLNDMRVEQALYDNETYHGQNAEVQSQWRRKFDEQLADLPAAAPPVAEDPKKASPKKPEPKKKGKTAKG